MGTEIAEGAVLSVSTTLSTRYLWKNSSCRSSDSESTHHGSYQTGKQRRALESRAVSAGLLDAVQSSFE